MFNLYSHQQVAKQNILRAWRRSLAVLYISPTGSGKTVIFLDTLNEVLKSGKRAIIAAPKTKVVKQTIEAVNEHYPRIQCGGLGGGLFELDSQLTIGTAKSIANNIDRIFAHAQVDYLIIDEAHSLGATTMQYIKIQAMRHNPYIKILGVTATPDRHDGFDLMQLFDIRYDINPKDLGKPLARAIFKDGDIETPEQAIWTYKRYADGRRTIVFCSTQYQAYYWHRFFKSAGYSTGVVDGTTNDFMRRRVEANAQIIFNVDVYTEGADIALISCVIIAKSAQTKSRTRYMQRIGRGLRPDTDDCIIIGRNTRWQAKVKTSKPSARQRGVCVQRIRTQGHITNSLKNDARTVLTRAKRMLGLIRKISNQFKRKIIMTKLANGLQGSGLPTSGKQEDIITAYNEGIQDLYDAYLARNKVAPNTISVPERHQHMFTLIANRLKLTVEKGQADGFILIDLVAPKMQQASVPKRKKMHIHAIEPDDEEETIEIVTSQADPDDKDPRSHLPVDGNAILLVGKDDEWLSSNLMAVAFTRSNSTDMDGWLRVWFHNGNGELCYVYEADYDEFVALVRADSIGAYHNRVFKTSTRKYHTNEESPESPYIVTVDEDGDEDSVVVGEPIVTIEPPVYETATDSGLPAFRIGIMGDSEQDYFDAITVGSTLCKTHIETPHQPTHVALPDDTPEEVTAFLQENGVLIADWQANDDEVWVGTVEKKEERSFSF